MTWIAACNGQRGIYQEVQMTDEERQKLCARLRAHEVVMWTDIDLAADEIERLAAELKQVESENEHHIRLAFVDAGANPARVWKEEAGRLAKDLAHTTRLLEINRRRSLEKSGGLEIKQSEHPIGFDDKPMTDWYYDDDGVCRPSRAADRSGK